MRVLVIDNYDSFTYNLVQALGAHGTEVEVHRNDEVSLDQIRSRAPDRIVISPGPKRPEDTGICEELILSLGCEVPILGVCIGHQCIAHAFGVPVRRADRIMHGKTSLVHHDGAGVLRDLPSPFEAMRYHSLLVEERDLPSHLVVTARSEEGEVMGLRHTEWPLEGVQFHPESYRTGVGMSLLGNFLGNQEAQMNS